MIAILGRVINIYAQKKREVIAKKVKYFEEISNV